MALSKDLLLFTAFLGFFYLKETHGQIILHSFEKEVLHRKMDSMIARCSSPPPIDAAGIDKCLEEFNALGLELKPEVEALGQRYWDMNQQYWEYGTSAEREANFDSQEYRRLRNEMEVAMYNAACKQITRGISCLSEFQEYFKNCGDEEGIALPYIGKAACPDDEPKLSVLQKLESSSREDYNCTRKETFRDDFRECTIENGLRKLIDEMEDTESISSICSLSTKAYKCQNKAFQKNCPGIGSKSLEVADEFIRSTINLANGEEENVKEAIKSCLPEPTN